MDTSGPARVLNKKTNRWVKVGGRVYKQLLRDGLIGPSAPAQQTTNELSSGHNAYPNEAFIATLDAHDSWDQLEPWRLICTADGFAFDVLFLIKAITTQINQIKSNNPYPVYPFNPFTKQPLRFADLELIKNKASIHKLVLSAPLSVFLEANELWSEDQNYTSTTKWMNMCIDMFRRSRMRFVRNIEHIGEDDVRLTGYWDGSNTELSNNEYWATIYADDPQLAMEFDSISIIQYDLVPFAIPESYYSNLFMLI